MKKSIMLLLSSILMIGMLAACSGEGGDADLDVDTPPIDSELPGDDNENDLDVNLPDTNGDDEEEGNEDGLDLDTDSDLDTDADLDEEDGALDTE